MRQVSISEAKNKLCELIDGLASGPVTITNRGKVVARLSVPEDRDEDARTADLVRRGILEPPKVKMTREELREFWSRPGIPVPEEAPSAVELLIQERRRDR